MSPGWDEEEDLLPLLGYQSSAADTAIVAGSGLVTGAATSGRESLCCAVAVTSASAMAADSRVKARTTRGGRAILSLL